MSGKRLALLFALFTVISAVLVLSPSFFARESASPTPAPPGLGPPDVVFFEATPDNCLSDCAWCGPFIEPPEAENLNEPIIGKPATTATVWAPFIGRGDLVNISEMAEVRSGEWYAFAFLVSVRAGEAGKYTLVVEGLGEMRVYVDGVYVTTVPASPLSEGWYNRFAAPGDFSEVARRVTISVKARFGSCGLIMRLEREGTPVDALCATRWIEGTAPGEAELAARSVSVQESAVLLPDGAFSLRAAAEGGLPLGWKGGAFTVSVFSGGKTAGRVELEPGEERDIPCRRGKAGALSEELAVVIEAGGREADRRTARLYNPDAFAEALERARKRAAALEKGSGRNADVELKLAQLETLKGDFSRTEASFLTVGDATKKAERFCGIHSELMEILAALERGRDPFAGKTGMLERGYMSEVDDSPQPYRVYLPDDFYTAPRPRPAVIFLHGYVPSYTIAEWGEELEAFSAAWNRLGAVVFQPFGRSNTDFQTVGEEDVLRVYRIALEEYGCDRRRVHLVGVSMGGMGVWTVGAHHPDLFASLAPMAGRTDYYTWHRCSPFQLPFWKNLLIRSWNPADLVPCYRYQNIVICHGKTDNTVLPAHTRLIAERFESAGIPYELHWLKGGHMSVFEKLEDPDFAAELNENVRHLGDKVSFRAWLPRYAARAWLSVPLFEKWGEPVNAMGEVRNGKVTVTAENALRVKIRPWPGVLHPGAKIEAVINGRAMPPAVLDADGLTYDLGKIEKDGPLKTPDLCGPAWQVLSEPFALVWGDGADRFRAERFAEWWMRFAKGKCLIYSASEAPKDLAAGRHLVLFGTPESNSMLADIAPSLPIGFERGRFTFPDGTSFDSTGRGLVFVYPNPRNPGRLVMVCSGLAWGRKLPLNHRFDFVPDYIVFEPRPGPGEGEDRVLAAGFFDSFWRFDRSLLWTPGGLE